MTSTAGLASTSPLRTENGRGALTGAAALWWTVTVLGQWAFLYYLAGFYVRAIVAGHPEDWNRNHMLFKGFAPTDPAWNLYFGAHVTLAAVIAFGGALQMVPQIRERAIGFHRWNGRACMLTAIGGALSGLWMTTGRGIGVSGKTDLGLIAINSDALLILAFAAIAWTRVRAGRIESHRRWALRLFMVANGVWFLRLMLFAWYILTKGWGMTDDLDGPMNIVIDFGSYLVPLAVLEVYLRAKDGGGRAARTAAAGLILASTAYMGLGIFALSMVDLPLVKLV